VEDIPDDIIACLPVFHIVTVKDYKDVSIREVHEVRVSGLEFCGVLQTSGILQVQFIRPCGALVVADSNSQSVVIGIKLILRSIAGTQKEAPVRQHVKSRRSPYYIQAFWRSPTLPQVV
jgi:hypothetical protein